MSKFKATKDFSCVSLPYMVQDEEIDNVIALWPPNWKINFKTGAKGTEGTSTTKVISPVITKDIEGPSKSTRKGTGAVSEKGSQPGKCTGKGMDTAAQRIHSIKNPLKRM